MYIIGWACLFLPRSLWKKGLDAASITLCASTCWPSSQARVTSVKSLSCLRLPNAVLTFSWKSFHFRQSFSDIMEQITTDTDQLIVLFVANLYSLFVHIIQLTWRNNCNAFPKALSLLRSCKVRQGEVAWIFTHISQVSTRRRSDWQGKAMIGPGSVTNHFLCNSSSIEGTYFFIHPCIGRKGRKLKD